jgi:hypothetical protein
MDFKADLEPYTIKEMIERNSPDFWVIYHQMWDAIRLGTPEALFFPGGWYEVVQNVLE